MKLTESDYHDINYTIGVIAQIKDDTPANKPASGLTLIEYLDIAAFILLSAKELFFDKNGKPKSFMKLIGNIGAIIRFVSQLVRMINRNNPKKKLNQ